MQSDEYDKDYRCRMQVGLQQIIRAVAATSSNHAADRFLCKRPSKLPQAFLVRPAK